jgi:hypothetical protein
VWVGGGGRVFVHAKVANRDVRGSGWEMSSRGRFGTPADSPLHDCSPDQGLHARREGLGFVRRSRTLFCRPVPSLRVTTRNFVVAGRCTDANCNAVRAARRARAKPVWPAVVVAVVTAAAAAATWGTGPAPVATTPTSRGATSATVATSLARRPAAAATEAAAVVVSGTVLLLEVEGTVAVEV